MTLRTTPGEHERNHGEATGTKRQPPSERVFQIVETQIATRQRYSSLVRYELHAEWPPDRVLEALLQQQQIGRTKPTILIAGQRHRAVNVGSAERLLKIERHPARTRGN